MPPGAKMVMRRTAVSPISRDNSANSACRPTKGVVCWGKLWGTACGVGAIWLRGVWGLMRGAVGVFCPVGVGVPC